MLIETRIIGDVQVFDCKGRLVLGPGTFMLRSGVRDKLGSGAKKWY
jgi:hypothetical protein